MCACVFVLLLLPNSNCYISNHNLPLIVDHNNGKQKLIEVSNCKCLAGLLCVPFFNTFFRSFFLSFSFMCVNFFYDYCHRYLLLKLTTERREKNAEEKIMSATFIFNRNEFFFRKWFASYAIV